MRTYIAGSMKRPVVEWVKQCECRGTASTNKVRTKPVAFGIGTEFKYHPGPSCDVYGKPWVKK